MRKNRRVSELESSVGDAFRKGVKSSQMPSVDHAFQRLDQRLTQYKTTLNRSNLDEEDKDALRDGLDLVFEEQGQQFRANNVYPVHLMDVSERLIDPDGIDCRDGDTALAALLHDLSEDVPRYNANPNLIGRRYNERVQRHTHTRYEYEHVAP